MASLASGAFITSINGKRCTAVPKAGANTVKPDANVATESQQAATTTTANVAEFTTAAVETTATLQDESSTSTTISTSLRLTTSASTSTTSDPPPQVQASAQVPPAAIVLEPEPTLTSEPPPAATISTVPTSAQIDTSQSQSQLQSQTQTQSQTQSQSQSQTQTQPAQTEQTALTQTSLPSAIIIQTSQTDNLKTAPATSTAADAAADTSTPPQGTALPDVSSSPALPDSATPLFTTIGTAQGPSNSAAADATGSSSSTNGAVSAVPISNNNNAVQSTVAIAGGVIGGVLAVSMVAFFVWWYRRKVMQKRRSTLLTPLTIDNTFGPDEKGPYVINRGSIGPTPRAERFKATLGYNIKKIRGSVSRIVTRGSSRGSTSAPSVNMNRGNSQFMEPSNANNRPGSSTTVSRGAEVTTKDRFMDWWTRLTADISFNWRLRNRKNPNSDDLFGSPRGMNEKRAGGGGGGGVPGAQPDFLTLLGMDDRELDREAQRRRMSASRQRGGSASSADRFLGGLDLNFGGSDDPFSDANAIAHISAKPAPLVVSQNNNPFSDANAVVPSVPKPGTYVAEMRRSRGQSVGGAGGAGQQRPPSSTVGGYRESGVSVESFGTRRNKFRSDPFDLERPELLGRTGGSMSSSAGATVGSSSRISGGVGTGDVRRPAGAHTRTDSFTSKYSSGISMGDWSDPGPDVGPAAARGAWEGPETRESPTQGWRNRLERESVARKERRTSGGSQGSVGKAM